MDIKKLGEDFHLELVLIDNTLYVTKMYIGFIEQLYDTNDLGIHTLYNSFRSVHPDKSHINLLLMCLTVVNIGLPDDPQIVDDSIPIFKLLLRKYKTSILLRK